MSEENKESSGKVTVYSTSSCPWCVKAKEYLKEKGVAYEDVDVAEDETARNAMIEKSGQMGVPVLDVHGTIIVGFDQDAIDKALGGDSSSELKQAA
jgi:glutaredoxin-like YruB-family protein